jgi:hypothetical protein
MRAANNTVLLPRMISSKSSMVFGELDEDN